MSIDVALAGTCWPCTTWSRSTTSGASGVQLAEVSKLLGHSELRLTVELNSHLQRETAAKAARVMDGILG